MVRLQTAVCAVFEDTLTRTQTAGFYMLATPQSAEARVPDDV